MELGQLASRAALVSTTMAGRRELVVLVHLARLANGRLVRVELAPTP